MRAFHWTAVAEQAALDLAEGELTDRQVAESAGVHFTTLYRWLKNSEFAARLAENKALLREAAQACAIAQRHHRIRRLNEHWYGLQRIIETRATAPEMQGEPGGSTGLLRRQVRRYGSGAKAVVVENFVLDTATLRELRLLEKQAAIEVGQWNVRRDDSDVVAPPCSVRVIKSAPLAHPSESDIRALEANGPVEKVSGSRAPNGPGPFREPSLRHSHRGRPPTYVLRVDSRFRSNATRGRRSGRAGSARS